MYRKIVVPYLLTRKKSKKLSYLREMKKAQWNSLEENTEIQKKELSDVLNFCKDNIDFYKKHLNINTSINPRNVIEIMDSLPILTKDDIRANFNTMLYKNNMEGAYKETSGGSTGVPVCFYMNKYSHEWIMTSKYLFNSWTGCNLGDKIVKIWGASRDIDDEGEGIKRKIERHLYNVKVLNSYKMSETDMDNIISSINREKPKLILSYAQSIYEIAKYINENRIKIYEPSAIMTSASVLLPHYREKIEDVFKVKVFDRYGSREVGDMACECENHEGLHINMKLHYLQIIDDYNNQVVDGERGNIVITTLKNNVMPLIKYKIGDIGIISDKQCSCGRGTKILKEITGRSINMFKTVNGDKIYPFFSKLFFFKDYIKQYQVVQEKIDLVIINLVLNNDFNEKIEIDLLRIKNDIKKIMGSKTRVEFRFLDNIECTDTGKHLYLISKV